MAVHVTKSQLRNWASELSFSEQENLKKSANSQSLDGATFLSHSSKDEDLVVGAMQVLKNHGARVYIDKIDPEMPPYTNHETAALLKRRISQTRRFVLLATENSKESNWVPWELGVADGYKGIGKIALFPASDTMYDKAWASWEYLGLYRRIVWGRLEGYSDSLWMVQNEKENTAIALRDWLTGY